jgi:hypothetical protein
VEAEVTASVDVSPSDSSALDAAGAGGGVTVGVNVGLTEGPTVIGAGATVVFDVVATTVDAVVAVVSGPTLFVVPAGASLEQADTRQPELNAPTNVASERMREEWIE